MKIRVNSETCERRKLKYAEIPGKALMSVCVRVRGADTRESMYEGIERTALLRNLKQSVAPADCVRASAEARGKLGSR
eukprot:2060025-Pyramimonas_sp.AAC.2